MNILRKVSLDRNLLVLFIGILYYHRINYFGILFIKYSVEELRTGLSTYTVAAVFL